MLLSNFISHAKGVGQYTSFYDSPTIKAAWLNDVAVPSPTAILKHQKDIFKTEHLVQQSPLIQELNKDLKAKTDVLNDINANIEKIEKYAQLIGSARSIDDLNTKATELQLKTAEQDIDKLIENIDVFFNNLLAMKDMKKVHNYLKLLIDKINTLKSLINKSSPYDGILANLAWTEYQIKGEYLEVRGKNWLNEKIPQNITVKTGTFLGQYNSKGQYKNKSMKEDLMSFTEDFTIQYTLKSEGHQITHTKLLSEFDNLTDTENYYIKEESYQLMRTKAIASIQAKATKVNRIKFGQINVYKDYTDEKGKALLTLREIYNNPTKGKRPYILNAHSDYEALFNYNLAHNINRVIGNNQLLLLRDDLVDMYSFIYEQFNAGRSFYGINVHLKGADGHKVSLNFKD